MLLVPWDTGVNVYVTFSSHVSYLCCWIFVLYE